jgi:hypothetical protein
MFKLPYKFILVILPIIFIILVVFQYILTNEFASRSRDISDYDQKIEFLKNQNELLLEQVSQTGSMEILEKYAILKGFVKPTNIVSIGYNLPIALNTDH